MTAAKVLAPEGQAVLRKLMLAWLEFERRLASVPVVARIETGAITREEYGRLLCGLRAQVVEGARWITRAASSFDRDHLEVRSKVILHARDEHRDYKLLESDFAAIGGDPAVIAATERNLGSEALHGFLMHRASQPNPIDLLGAMFMIEGLGDKMARGWAQHVRDALGVGPEATRFLGYHGENDANHLSRLHELLDSPHVDARTGPRIVRTAKVVGRLYAMQLEEIDHA